MKRIGIDQAAKTLNISTQWLMEIISTLHDHHREDLAPKSDPDTSEYCWRSAVDVEIWYATACQFQSLVENFGREELPSPFTVFKGVVNPNGHIVSTEVPHPMPNAPDQGSLLAWRFELEEVDVWVDYKGRGFRVVHTRTGADLSGPVHSRDWNLLPVVYAVVNTVTTRKLR